MLDKVGLLRSILKLLVMLLYNPEQRLYGHLHHIKITKNYQLFIPLLIINTPLNGYFWIL